MWKTKIRQRYFEDFCWVGITTQKGYQVPLQEHDITLTFNYRPGYETKLCMG
jgi:hypothetical protein